VIIHNYEDIEALEIMEGVKKRVIIGDKEGAPNFIMRIFDLDPGKSSPFHDHYWEHEIFVLKGNAVVKNAAEEEMPIREGDAVLIQPHEKHCLTNKGEDIFRFICLIPKGAE
jgi:quercetin dioxygenase-like cupin family protein